MYLNVYGSTINELHDQFQETCNSGSKNSTIDSRRHKMAQRTHDIV